MLQGILQYFQPSFSYQFSLRPLFCLFLSGSFTQVLLYMQKQNDGQYDPVYWLSNDQITN